MSDLAKKRQVRGGHRASAKRMINEATSIMESRTFGEQIREKLDHIKFSLQRKISTLNELNEDLIELLQEEDIAADIQEADAFRDTIEFAIIDINLFLSIPERSQPHLRSQPFSPQFGNASEPAETVPALNNTTPSQQGINRVKVKLPKLELPKFKGDSVAWLQFWDTCESSIHHNTDLSPIDKFNYLNSLLEGQAANAIRGLPIKSSNYDEAIDILTKRFGRTQTITNKHSVDLVQLQPVKDITNLKGLRCLHDNIEAHIRSLKSLGIPLTTYSALLSPIVTKKLPSELELIISRQLKDQEWNLELVMEYFEAELKARERTSTDKQHLDSQNRRQHIASSSKPATTSALYTETNSSASRNTTKCTYCRGQHTSNSCKVVSQVTARREALNRMKRCYVCLRRDHFGRNCPTERNCPRCNARHHVSICPSKEQSQLQSSTAKNESYQSTTATKSAVPATTLYAYHADQQTHVFPQTARVNMSGTTNSHNIVNGRVLIDGGSQRCYITCQMRRKLRLRTVATTTIVVKTFGAVSGKSQIVDVVELLLRCGDNKMLITAYVVPVICQPICTGFLEDVKRQYPHLATLTLADYATNGNGSAEIDVLIGMDHYWDFVSSNAIPGESGPVALQTKFGWVLSGPAHIGNGQLHQTCLSLHITQEDRLEEQLRQFWNVESLGLMLSSSISERHQEGLKFDGSRYTVRLPWKQPHPLLPDNYSLSLKRFRNLFKKLKGEPRLLEEYDAIIKQQIRESIIEEVNTDPPDVGNVHYLPHHGVVRQDKTTTKLRIVYDAPSRSDGLPSLNDCLHAGPSLNQKIFDIILRFRTYRIGVTADVEKAFLMVSIDEEDRDYVRFIWVDDIHKTEPQLKIYRFTRVVFGLTSSPFLLNATIRSHMEKFANTDPNFVSKVLRSIYVDDVTSGANSEEEAKEFYEQARATLATGGFNLRKFGSNSASLNDVIKGKSTNFQSPKPAIQEKDTTYVKTMFGHSIDEDGKVLGVRWNSSSDNFIFDLGPVAEYAEKGTPTKRHVVSVAAKFFDPLGYMSPFIVKFKLFFQQLCQANVHWDDKLEGEFLRKWNLLLSALSSMEPRAIPRFYLHGINEPVTSYDLIGFCDASTRAYAAVVFLRSNTEETSFIKFVASKTRIAPTAPTTVPRLELLSALLLARLINSIGEAIKEEIQISNIFCFTDSKVAYHWIRNEAREWKQYVQNRVNEIRCLTSASFWRHCSGVDNPADLPSRGSNPQEFFENTNWNRGPEWLPEFLNANDVQDFKPDDDLPEILSEMKASKNHIVMLVDVKRSISQIMDCTKYSDIERLFRVTAYVLRFIRLLKTPGKNRLPKRKLPEYEITPEDMLKAETLWLKEIQLDLQSHKNFECYRKQFDIYSDPEGVLRCRGRLGLADIPECAKFPVIISPDHHLSSLLVRRAHLEVMHSGVKATLTQLRSRYWMLRGRQFVRKIIHRCQTCRRFDTKPYDGPPAPPLPEFRVRKSPPFAHIGVDFAGPLYVQSESNEMQKNWLCLYTCTVTRAVHLELVPDMSSHAFLCSFRRFTSRRGKPLLVISDNGKTFKAAAKVLKPIQWSFNLEKAPWWGGIFERMIKSAKRCLKKSIGGARLTHDELATVIVEVEAALNSRPITYILSDDLEEPLTPSHLLHGRRLLDTPETDQPNLNLEMETDSTNLNTRFTHLTSILEHFWSRWHNEYLLELRNTHHTGVQGPRAISSNDIVIVRDDDQPRTIWKLGKIVRLITGNDGKVRGAVVRVCSKNGKVTTLRRPVQRLYPLETSPRADTEPTMIANEQNEIRPTPLEAVDKQPQLRPKRKAATKAMAKITNWDR